MSTKVLPISAFIICKDEQNYIGHCIESLNQCCEIIIVDSGSSDNTPQIIQSYIDKGWPIRFVTESWRGYAGQKQYALDLCAQEWCLSIDADERLDRALQTVLPALINDNTADAWRIARRPYLIGYGYTPENVRERKNLRLLRRGKGAFRLTDKVHEGISCTGRVKASRKGSLLHFRPLPIEEQLLKENNYSTLKAQQLTERDKSFRPLKIIFNPPIYFLRLYLRNGLWRCGFSGYIEAMTGAIYAFLTESKLYQKEVSQKIPPTEEKNTIIDNPHYAESSNNQQKDLISMKIFHFHFGKEGGAERFFVQLAQSLTDQGVEQKVVMRPNRLWQQQIAKTAKIIALSNFRNLSLDRLLLPLKVNRLIQREKPDVLFAWMPKSCQLMPDYKECLKITRLGDYPQNLKHFDNIDIIICNTPGIAEHVRSLGWKRDIKVISNFTSTTVATPYTRSKLDTPKDAFLVSTMGRFVPRKGIDLVIDAVYKIPECYLWIIGSGREEKNLRDKVKTLGMEDRVRFTGWQADPRPYISASDAFCAASRVEPLGNVVLEAWGQNCPVVSTRSQGPSWFMKNERDGLLTAIDDVEAIAASFTRIRNDPALAKSLVEGGRATLENKFSREAITQEYIKLFSRHQTHEK